MRLELMERTVERYKFRLHLYGSPGEYSGRIIIDGKMETLQIWYKTPNEPNGLLEVGPVDKRKAMWPLFRRLCEYKGIIPLEFRRTQLSTGPAPWEPIPGG